MGRWNNIESCNDHKWQAFDKIDSPTEIIGWVGGKVEYQQAIDELGRWLYTA